VEALALRGRSILLVENEPLIAHALHLVERAGLSGAVLDYGLRGGNCAPVCERLEQRRIPFLIYSGYPDLLQRFPDAVIIPKPAPLDDVTEALCALLSPAIALARFPATQTDHARR
jgi:hypothetical protein